MSDKKLHRSATDKKLLGVCGGLSEYFGFDSKALRIIWAIITLCTGIGPCLIIYLIIALLMPQDS